jgi:type II secretory pathway component GspD/PulD (secretin)
LAPVAAPAPEPVDPAAVAAAVAAGLPPPEPPKPLVPIRQVQIQVWISETNEQGLRDIGNNLTYKRIVQGVEQNGSVQQVNTSTYELRDQFSRVALPAPDQAAFNPAATSPPLRPDEAGTIADGLQTRTGFGLSASVISDGHGTLDTFFRAAETKSDVDLISKPELLVAENGKALIKAGGDIPFQDVTYAPTTGVPQLGIKWRPIGVTMEMTPAILSDDSVMLKVDKLEVTDIARFDNSRGIDLPVFSKRSQTGYVQVPSGQTLVIGGLSSRVVRRTERRVPVVGKLPILGFPFRGRSSEAEITTLLVFVSPTIVDLRNLSKEAVGALNFWEERGNEWENTDRIQEEITALETQ